MIAARGKYVTKNNVYELHKNGGKNYFDEDIDLKLLSQVISM